MVDGVHGHVDHVVRHAVMERKHVQDNVTYLQHLPALQTIILSLNATTNAVLVSFCDLMCTTSH